MIVSLNQVVDEDEDDFLANGTFPTVLKEARNLLVDLQEGNIVGALPLGEETSESLMKGLRFINEMRG